MHIGIDASFLHFAGVGRYIQCLLLGLDALKLDDRIYVYVQANRRVELECLELENVILRDVEFESQSLFSQIKWRKLLERDKINIFHAPHYVHPLWLPQNIKLVITLHDAVYFRFPPSGYKGGLIRIYYNFFMRQAVKNAEKLCTVSNFSRLELSSFLGINADQINVIPSGLSPNIVPVNMNDCGKILGKLALPERYFFYVGSNKPWKNIEFLLSAFLETCPSETGAMLVIAGTQGKNEPDIRNLINSELLPHIRLLGVVTEEQLRCLYSGAIATLVPSLYEGFGYSALEAMGCACPVIASSAASLPEVVGEAGILANPYVSSEWTSAMLSLISDNKLRRKLQVEGYKRSLEFSVVRMAKNTHAIYRQCVEK